MALLKTNRRLSLTAASNTGQGMKRSIGILCGLVLSALAGPVHAQEYFDADGGMYISVRGGLSQVRNHVIWDWGGYDPTYVGSPPTLASPGLNAHRESRSLEMNYGFVAAGALGYTFAYPDHVADLRLEVEGIYRYNAEGQTNADWRPTSNRADSGSLGFITVDIDGTLQIQSVMLNALADFHTGSRFTPILGIGAGMSHVVIDTTFFDPNRAQNFVPQPVIDDQSFFALSWQAIAGIGYRLSPGTVVTAEYRYFRLAKDQYSTLFQTHELRNIKFDDWSLGLRFTF